MTAAAARSTRRRNGHPANLKTRGDRGLGLGWGWTWLGLSCLMSPRERVVRIRLDHPISLNIQSNAPIMQPSYFFPTFFYQ